MVKRMLKIRPKRNGSILFSMSENQSVWHCTMKMKTGKEGTSNPPPPSFSLSPFSTCFVHFAYLLISAVVSWMFSSHNKNKSMLPASAWTRLSLSLGNYHKLLAVQKWLLGLPNSSEGRGESHSRTILFSREGSILWETFHGLAVWSSTSSSKRLWKLS